jgi:hypothetical protein
MSLKPSTSVAGTRVMSVTTTDIYDLQFFIQRFQIGHTLYIVWFRSIQSTAVLAHETIFWGNHNKSAEAVTISGINIAFADMKSCVIEIHGLIKKGFHYW